MKTEPVRIVAAIEAAIIAVWGVLIVAIEIESELAGAVTVAIGAVVGAVSAIVVRQRVSPIE